jgi:adenosylmethionine-8-amino-7-oxononanoate aminotransferase
MFYHSSSYTANPIACAAAVANLDVWMNEPVLERVKALSAKQTDCLATLQAEDDNLNARQIGTITAIDVPVEDTGYLAEIAPRLYEYFLKRGVLLRPLGNTVYVMPPYCTKAEELEMIYGTISDAIKQAL